MRFRLIPKSVTLNDLERRNGPYFTEFGTGSFRGALHKSVRVQCRRKKFAFAISSPGEFPVFITVGNLVGIYTYSIICKFSYFAS